MLLPAAGSGERLGKGPKAFLRLGGKTLLERALEAFAWADEIRVALPPGHTLQDEVNVTYRSGGASRQESVYLLLQEARGELVLVHDVARPFVVPEAVERLLEAAQKTGAATLAATLADTLVQNWRGRYGSVLPREDYQLVQTPQGFRRELLLEAHRQALAAGISASDDAQIVMRLGHAVALVPGDRRMFKITYPEDLEIAEGLAKSWKS